MPMYSEHLPTRVPEFLQDDETQLYEYLEACGEIFDQFGDTIKEQDAYKDYKRVPEARLILLSQRFAFNPPNMIPENLLRGIIRDITWIYTTKGVIQSLTWVFRLIGWDTDIEYAWLLNPERYDPRVKELYPQFFERDGLENDASLLNTFFPQLGDGYKLGDYNVRYHNDPSRFIIQGELVIGRNDITSLTGEGNPYTTEINRVTTSYTKLDYRNFVYGDAVVKAEGTFFTGKSYFSRITDVREAKIIGENYRDEDIIRYYPSVISTPYIIVNVDSEDYDKFTRPYVASDGTVYSYTTREKFSITQTLIEYLLYEFVRPANVRILLVVSEYEDYDQLHLNESAFSLDAVAEPWDNTEYPLVESTEVSTIPITAPVIGTENFLVGAPSYLPHNSMMQADKIRIGQGPTIDLVAHHGVFDYWNLPISVNDLGGGIYETPAVVLRTPSSIVVDVDETVTMYGRISVEHSYVDVGTLSSGSHVIDTFDYLNIKFRTTSLQATINTRITWNDPTKYTGSVDSPYVTIS